MGDSGTGKTEALCSLVLAGYKLRILDLDNGLDIVKSYLTEPLFPVLSSDPSAEDRPRRSGDLRDDHGADAES